MLAEFFNAVVNLGQKAKAVQFETHPQLPTKVFVRHGDELQEKDAPAPFRSHGLAGLDDLVNALADKAIAPAPEVYVAANRVRAFLNRADRRELVTVDLVETKRFKLVTELQTPRSMQPKEAVKMLKLDLHGGNVAQVIQPLSRIEFTRTGTGRTSVDHGKESLGRSVEAQVQNAKDVPEAFDLAVPVWSTSGFDRFGVLVKFGLYLDLEAQTVELRVLADEIERVRNQALVAVVRELGARLEGVPIFLGTP